MNLYKEFLWPIDHFIKKIEIYFFVVHFHENVYRYIYLFTILLLIQFHTNKTDEILCKILKVTYGIRKIIDLLRVYYCYCMICFHTSE